MISSLGKSLQKLANGGSADQRVTVPKMLNDTDTDTLSGTKYF